MQTINLSFQEFIDNYTQEDSEWLALEWNEKFGAKFKDANYLFRMQIAELVCEQIHTVSLDLIRELFITMGKTTQLNFVVFNKFNLFAQELLERGGKDYLFDYVCAAHVSFDTFLSTADITLSDERRREILAHFDFLKATESDAQVQKLLSDHLRNRFVK